MPELMKREEELAKAETASHDVPLEQHDGPKLVKGQKLEAPDKAAVVSEPVPLFSDSEMKDFRSQWSKLRTGFVDEPRRAVEDADKLLASVMQPLAEGFTNQRSGLEKQWTAATTCLLRPAYCHTALSFVF